MNLKIDAPPSPGEDLANCIKRALELGLSLGNSSEGSSRSVVIDAVATKISALAWLWQRGTVSLPDRDAEPEWTSVTRSQLFPKTMPCESFIGKIIRTNRNRAAISKKPTSKLRNTAVTSDCKNWHAIVCVEQNASGKVDLIQFIRPISHQPFTECERVFVSIVMESLAHREQLQKCIASSSHLTDGLAKRQREVLNLLLSGKSHKEIAANLGISHHTVNDYSKSLYRHFEVHSRAELAAYFRNHDESHAPVDV